MVLITSIGATLGTSLLANLDLNTAHVARTKFMRTTRMAMRIEQGRKLDPSSAAGTPRRSHLGRVIATMDIEGPLYCEGSIEHLLASVFGADAVAGVGDPFTHTFTESDPVVAAKSAVTVEMPLSGSVTDALIANGYVTRLEVSGGGSAEAVYKAQLLLGKPLIGAKTAATLTTTPPVPGHHNLVPTIDGVTDFFTESWRFWWDHHNYADGFDGNLRTRRVAPYGEWDAGFDHMLRYDSVTGKDLIEKSWDADGATAFNETDAEENTYAANFKIKAQGSPERSIAWDSGAVVLDPITPEPTGRDILRSKVSGRGLDNGTIAGARCLLLNSVAGVIA